jgi:excisionase family DNA binding protein
VAEAARAAGVSERTMRRWIRDGRLAGCYKVGGRVRIPERALHDAAEPYGGAIEMKAPSDGVKVRHISEAQLRRAKLAFERIDRILASARPPSGPDDTAEAYIRQGRDEQDAKWDRLLGFEPDDPGR